MSLVTFAVRYPMLVIFGKLNPPDSIFRALKYVPPAVLTAIIVPALILPDGYQLTIKLTNAYLLAGFVAFGVAWRSRNLLWTIIIGMATFWIWRWVLTF
jgi:branched-subunit amino acid transport protein